MAKGDVKLLTPLPTVGSRTFQVASGGAATIKAGEFVLKALGAAAVSVLTTLAPSVGTSYTAGLSMTTSTDTASAAGTVDVLPVRTDMVFSCPPVDSTLWDTQSEYNALVGDRVRIQVSGGNHRILSGDDTYHAFVVEQLDVIQYPAVVAFSVRAAALYNA